MGDQPPPTNEALMAALHRLNTQQEELRTNNERLAADLAASRAAAAERDSSLQELRGNPAVATQHTPASAALLTSLHSRRFMGDGTPGELDRFTYALKAIVHTLGGTLEHQFFLGFVGTTLGGIAEKWFFTNVTKWETADAFLLDLTTNFKPGCTLEAAGTVAYTMRLGPKENMCTGLKRFSIALAEAQWTVNCLQTRLLINTFLGKSDRARDVINRAYADCPFAEGGARTPYYLERLGFHARIQEGNANLAITPSAHAGPSPMVLGAFRPPLTTAEKQHRASHGLCLYCGDKNHQVGECPKCPKSNIAGGISAPAPYSSYPTLVACCTSDDPTPPSSTPWRIGAHFVALSTSTQHTG
jgi:hypothetical protein